METFRGNQDQINPDDFKSDDCTLNDTIICVHCHSSKFSLIRQDEVFDIKWKRNQKKPNNMEKNQKK